ncbi:DUF6498-containing protein [Halorubrum vacuolatum]|uniref:Uncharacterized protein n=1 Tax=Halorubrum vacuolatum TaxID=63740 RepID=A0A238UNJ0_HALVU|nr:DUF6498-containing protein [Halorubrum vacuolatum]SNR23491.1 hypothetical protein SAMN06264855_101127 [Halorubrum vacuolatum]
MSVPAFLPEMPESLPRFEALTVGFVNLLPLVGVVGFGWNVAALLTLYWLELGVVCVWALVRATVAGRPSEFENDPLILGPLGRKHVAIPLPFTALSIRLSSLPVVVIAIPVLAVFWFFAGVMTVGFVGLESVDDGIFLGVVVSAAGIFVSEGVRTGVTYVHRGEYRKHSAQTAIQGPFIRVGTLILGAMAALTVAAIVDPAVETDEPIHAVDPTVTGSLLLVGVIMLKLSIDLVSVYRDRLEAFDESQALDLGFLYEPPEVKRIETSLATDPVHLRPTLSGRIAGGVTNLRRHPSAVFVGMFFLAVAALFAVGRAWNIALSIGITGVSVMIALGQIDYWLRYGWIEYRTDGDAIVAYDRRFRTPLWRVESWDELDLRVEQGWVDGWLDTATVIIMLQDRTLRLPHLDDPDPVLDTFDRKP